MTFFVSTFLPYFRARVIAGRCPDPLARFSLVGHSFGGMIVNLILRGNAPMLATMTHVVTVATPFYGYAGQVHRWFEGEKLLNFFGLLEQQMIETIASMPGLYTLHFLDGATCDANESALIHRCLSDCRYPSVDSSNATQRADPYNPQTNASLVRFPSMTGFDFCELQVRAAPVPAARLADGSGPAAEVLQHPGRADGPDWNHADQQHACQCDLGLDPAKLRREGHPADHRRHVPAWDGTQPAWTTCLVTNAPQRCITVKAFGIDHMFMMSHPSVLQAIATISARVGVPRSPPETALPEEAADEEIVEFLRWLSQNLLVVRRFKGFGDPELRRMLSKTGFENRLPNRAPLHQRRDEAARTERIRSRPTKPAVADLGLLKGHEPWPRHHGRCPELEDRRHRSDGAARPDGARLHGDRRLCRAAESRVRQAGHPVRVLTTPRSHGRPASNATGASCAGNWTA